MGIGLNAAIKYINELGLQLVKEGEYYIVTYCNVENVGKLEIRFVEMEISPHKVLMCNILFPLVIEQTKLSHIKRYICYVNNELGIVTLKLSDDGELSSNGITFFSCIPLGKEVIKGMFELCVVFLKRELPYINKIIHGDKSVEDVLKLRSANND